MDSQLCLVINPARPIPGEQFTLTVVIDPIPPPQPEEGEPTPAPAPDCVATEFGFGWKVCTDDDGVVDVAGVVAGKIGLGFFPSPVDAVSFVGVTLGGGGIVPSINFPLEVVSFATPGDDFARVSFTTPTPAPGYPGNSERSVVTGRGAIATFTFSLSADARNFTVWIDPQHTSFETASSNNRVCDFDPPLPSTEEGPWPISIPPAISPPLGFPLSTISGTVQFWRCIMPTSVPFTTLTLNTDPPGANELVTVNHPADGTYLFNVAPDANYRLYKDPGQGVYRTDDAADFTGSPTITDVTNAITAADVGLIMMHWNDPDGHPLDACTFMAPDCGDDIFPQRVAADVNRWKTGLTGCSDFDTDAGRITGQDASILQQVIAARILGTLGMPLDYPLGCAPNWVFFCDTARFSGIPPEGSVYDPIAVLIGDVNGSYTNNPTVARKPMLGTSLEIPVVSSKEPRVMIPVELIGADAVIGVEAKVLFNPNVLRFVRAHAPVSPRTGEATNHAWGVANQSGALALVVTGLTRALSGSSTVALLEFERVDPTARRASSPILITNALADDMTLETNPGFFSTNAVAKATWGEVKGLYR